MMDRAASGCIRDRRINSPTPSGLRSNDAGRTLSSRGGGDAAPPACQSMSSVFLQQYSNHFIKSFRVRTRVSLRTIALNEYCGGDRVPDEGRWKIKNWSSDLKCLDSLAFGTSRCRLPLSHYHLNCELEQSAQLSKSVSSPATKLILL